MCVCFVVGLGSVSCLFLFSGFGSSGRAFGVSILTGLGSMPQLYGAAYYERDDNEKETAPQVYHLKRGGFSDFENKREPGTTCTPR